eukprot:gene6071-10079_t
MKDGRSVVWNYMTHDKLTHITSCNHCDWTYDFNQGKNATKVATTILIRHLHKQHPSIKIIDVITPQIDYQNGQQNLRALKIIVVQMKPWCFIQNSEFQNYSKGLDESYSISDDKKIRVIAEEVGKKLSKNTEYYLNFYAYYLEEYLKVCKIGLSIEYISNVKIDVKILEKTFKKI